MNESWAIAIFSAIMAGIGAIWLEVRAIRQELGDMVKRTECTHSMGECYKRLSTLERNISALNTYHKGMKGEEYE